ncbi:hypothetical protein CRG98_048468 [Punica granatum]|uniref:Subtilisin-like protease fibronectin type-III domain-containing protein n=1 Tax=Punica granatum TaxID=22663 RepID=A0A2I0HHH2_PUNGR|nr:hypothetical protein CRG98_048468 [Punica granatum]
MARDGFFLISCILAFMFMLINSILCSAQDDKRKITLILATGHCSEFISIQSDQFCSCLGSRFQALAMKPQLGRNPQGRIVKGETVPDPTSPVTASFSSSGPSVMTPDIMKDRTNVRPPTSTYKAKAVSASNVNITVVPEVLSFKSISEMKSFMVGISGSGLKSGTQLSEEESAYGSYPEMDLATSLPETAYTRCQKQQRNILRGWGCHYPLPGLPVTSEATGNP